MKGKNTTTFTKADAIIVRFLGTSASEFYGEKYKAIDENVKQMESDSISEVDENLVSGFAEKAAKIFQPFINATIEKNKNSSNAFAKLKALITQNNPGIATSINAIIDSLEKGVQDAFTSAKNSASGALKVLDYMTSTDGLMFVPAGTRKDSTELKSEKKRSISFLKEKLTGEIIHEDDSITVIINCDNQSRELFLTGYGFAETGAPVNGKVEFKVPDKGDYVLSVDGKDFIVLSLS